LPASWFGGELDAGAVIPAHAEHARATWIVGGRRPTLVCGMAAAAAGSPQLVGKLPSW
jgi:hypothetical protein